MYWEPRTGGDTDSVVMGVEGHPRDETGVLLGEELA